MVDGEGGRALETHGRSSIQRKVNKRGRMSGRLVSGSSVAWLRSEWKHGEGTLAASYASPCWRAGGAGACGAHIPLPLPLSPLPAHRPSSAVKAVACQSFFWVTFSRGDDWPPGEGVCSTPQTAHHNHHPVALVNSRTCFARDAKA